MIQFGITPIIPPGIIPIPAPPAIAVQIAIWMVTSRLTGAQAAAKAAQEYSDFRDFKEAEITDLAIELGRTTDVEMEIWFNVLRSIQQYGIFVPVPDITAIPEELRLPGMEKPTEPTPAWVWYVLAGLGGMLILNMGRDG